MRKIDDEYTDLQVTRARKWQLRHPERNKEIQNNYRHSDAGRATRQAVNARYYAKKKAEKLSTSEVSKGS